MSNIGLTFLTASRFGDSKAEMTFRMILFTELGDDAYRYV
jgi:hypothetical protein